MMRYGFGEGSKAWILKAVVALLLFGAGGGAVRGVLAQDAKPDAAGTATGAKGQGWRCSCSGPAVEEYVAFWGRTQNRIRRAPPRATRGRWWTRWGILSW